jgi:hypothetical protein
MGAGAAAEQRRASLELTMDDVRERILERVVANRQQVNPVGMEV